MVAPGDLINKVTLLPQVPTADSFALPTPPEVGDLFDIIQSNLLAPILGGGLFQNPIQGPIADCLNAAFDINFPETIIPGSIPDLRAQHLIAFPNPINQDALLLTAFDDATSGLGDFGSHSNSLVGGLAGNMGPVISGLRVKQSVGGGLPIGNPCTALNDVYGSILGDGAALIAGLAAALGSLIASAIQDALGPILDMIAKEIAALNAILSQLTSFASANSLRNLTNDPCAQALFNSAGTPGLLNVLSNMPKF